MFACTSACGYIVQTLCSTLCLWSIVCLRCSVVPGSFTCIFLISSQPPCQCLRGSFPGAWLGCGLYWSLRGSSTLGHDCGCSPWVPGCTASIWNLDVNFYLKINYWLLLVHGLWSRVLYRRNLHHNILLCLLRAVSDQNDDALLPCNIAYSLFWKINKLKKNLKPLSFNSFELTKT